MESTLSPQNEPEASYLTDLDQIMGSEIASVGQRFVNLLIDSIVIYILNVIVQVIIFILTAKGVLNIHPYDTWTLVGIELVVAFVYYISFEGLSAGRTVGKWCTGTKVVKDNSEESPISAKDAFMRTMVRYVPFDGFSAFGGYPWHDVWTHTKVIKAKK